VGIRSLGRSKIGFVLAKTDTSPVFFIGSQSTFAFGPALTGRTYNFADARRRLVWAYRS
jgi:hypothetical protein